MPRIEELELDMGRISLRIPKRKDMEFTMGCLQDLQTAGRVMSDNDRENNLIEGGKLFSEATKKLFDKYIVDTLTNEQLDDMTKGDEAKIIAWIMEKLTGGSESEKKN